MYAQFYGLKDNPFNITSNPKMFFESASHREAVAALLYGINQRKGIILITGEVGIGKTTLCKFILEKLPEQIKTSIILNPCFSELELLRAIIEDFGIPKGKVSRLGLINRLNGFLVNNSSGGSNAVLIVDEAQNLGVRQLEQIRLLSNLETSDEKLLQIILVGQPELLEKINQPNLRQIRQRIFVKYNLAPLKEEEIKEYIDFRFRAAGTEGVQFSPDSYKLIYDFSGGIPRLINMLCDRALLLGFVKERSALDTEIFETCIQELK